MSKQIIVIGAGASGCFAAINIAQKLPNFEVMVLEKSTKTLQKVKVSGGGRCNVTNARQKVGDLVKFYPRGGKQLYKVLERFGTLDMVAWLKARGVATKAEADQRVFPISDDSQTIIDCFHSEMRSHKVRLETSAAVEQLSLLDSGQWKVACASGKQYIADRLILATGSSQAFWQILAKIGIKLNPPVPSLFTFNIKDSRLNGLAGVSFAQAHVRVATTKLVENGPLLITHWGLSGPAILKLSAWGARVLAGLGYSFDVLINFLGDKSQEEFRAELGRQKSQHPTRKVANYSPAEIPKRYWENLLHINGLPQDQTFGELSNKHINKLVEELCQGVFKVEGKSTFKEEFVTCGGVDLSEVDLQTMKALRFPNLYFTGEVLDIDALTGGFNFQACWSTGWVISEALKAELAS